jgi:hypothetical protein
MKKIYLTIIVISYIFSGCHPMITKQDFAPLMYKQHPSSILVLPPQNNSTAADAKEYYLTTIAEPLTNSGYYVYPIEIVNDVFKQEGLSDTETMINVPPQKFKEYFGADAVMYVTIMEWNTSYLVFAGSVTVKISCELKSTATGDVLWFYDDAITVNTTSNSGGGGLAGLLADAIATAVATATTEYVPLAREVNKKLLISIPYGKYHQQYGKDQAMQIQKKQNVKENK